MPEATELEEVTRWPGRSGATAEISVLIPCWHGEETIGGALDGVEAQQGLPERLGVEIVVVVDGRQDDRDAVYLWIASRGSSRRWAITLVFHTPNRGAGRARKAGYRYCSGTFLALLDDDDVWHSQKLARQWDSHQANPERMASGHGYGIPLGEHEVGFLRLLIGGYHLHNSTVMIRRSLWPYEPEPYRFGEDWLMLAMMPGFSRSTSCPTTWPVAPRRLQRQWLIRIPSPSSVVPFVWARSGPLAF